MKPRILLAFGLVGLAAALRLLPHPPNVTPVAALALFGGAHFQDKRLAFGAPLLAMLLSDLVLGFHSLLPLVYVTFAATVLMGMFLSQRRSLLAAAGAAAGASTLFFLVTNFGVWAGGTLYPMSISGLITCFVAAVPFYGYSIAGDLAYTLALFGAFAMAERKMLLFAPQSGA